jgi:hypothetical protein
MARARRDPKWSRHLAVRRLSYGPIFLAPMRKRALARHIIDSQMGIHMKIQSDRYADAGIGENWVSASSAYRFEHDPCLPSQKQVKRGRRRPDLLRGV